MRARTTLRKALEDPNLLGQALPGDSWAAWRALLLATMGEKLKPAELEHFKRLTGRSEPPPDRVSELWVIAGRRGGKSRAIATLLAYIGTLCDHRAKLSSGEQGVALCLAPSQAQAEVVLNYCAGIINESPILKQLIARQTAETIELNNRITIEVRSASFRRLRGPTLVAVVLDEIAFLHSDESANPDREIINAIRPALGTTNGLLACISSPYARRGELWNAFKSEYGDEGDPSILLAKGGTRDLNPSYEQAKIDREYERDAAYAAAEYGGEFRTDVESFLRQEAIEQCVRAGVYERPYEPRHRYVGFVDPSGGSGDSFTVAIAHKEGETSVIDVMRERKAPCEPPAVVEEFSHILRRYHVNSIEGDHYAGEWPASIFRQHGITYEPAELSKSDIYRDALPLLNGRKALLLDNKTMQRQLVSLERKTSRSGRDSIDHPPGAKDDVANAVCGALILAQKNNAGLVAYDDDCDIPYPANWDKQFA
jgi:hypothetical protein